MVVESLLFPEDAAKKRLVDYLLGIGYGTLGLLIALWIFRDHAGLVMVFITTMAALPFFYRTMKAEEKADIELKDEKKILKHHAKAITYLLLIFLGITTAYAIWYVALPAQTASQVYSVQTQTIVTINKGITGNVAKLDLFSKIFLNNVEVLFFSLLFSFLFGAGAIFILTWNASVIGVALGNFMQNATKTAIAAGSHPLTAHAIGISTSGLRYMIHGIPEILGYIVAALAGGIISAAVIKHDFRTKHFEKLVLDSTDLIIVALAFLFVAALLEVYVTPRFF